MGKSKPKKCCRVECDNEIGWAGGYYFGKKCHCCVSCSKKTIKEFLEAIYKERARKIQPPLFK